MVHENDKENSGRVLEAIMTEPWVSAEDLVKHLGVTKDRVYPWIENNGHELEQYHSEH